MPTFPKNTSPAMYKKSSFKMKGSPMKRNFGLPTDTAYTGNITFNPNMYEVEITKGNKKTKTKLTEKQFQNFIKNNPSGDTKVTKDTPKYHTGK